MAEIVPPINDFSRRSYDGAAENTISYPRNFEFMVPPGVNSLLCEAIGAGGSASHVLGSGSEPGGGGGAYSRRTFSVTPYEKFLFCLGSSSNYVGDPDDGTQTVIVKNIYTETTLLNIPIDVTPSFVGGATLRFAAQSYTTGNSPEIITSVSFYMYSESGDQFYINLPRTEVKIREGSVTGKVIRISFSKGNDSFPTVIANAAYVTYFFAPAYLKPNTQYFFVIDAFNQGWNPILDPFPASFVAIRNPSVYSGGTAWIGTAPADRTALTQQTYDLVMDLKGYVVNSSDVVVAVGGERGIGATPGAGGLAADCIGEASFSGGSGAAAQGGGGSRAGSGGGAAAGSSSNGGVGGVGSGGATGGSGGTGGTGTFAGGNGGAGGDDSGSGIGGAIGGGQAGFWPGGGGGGMASVFAESVVFSAPGGGAFGGVKFTYEGTEYKSNPSMMSIFVP